jgi:hypothetical protein
VRHFDDRTSTHGNTHALVSEAPSLIARTHRTHRRAEGYGRSAVENATNRVNAPRRALE